MIRSKARGLGIGVFFQLNRTEINPQNSPSFNIHSRGCWNLPILLHRTKKSCTKKKKVSRNKGVDSKFQAVPFLQSFSSSKSLRVSVCQSHGLIESARTPRLCV